MHDLNPDRSKALAEFRCFDRPPQPRTVSGKHANQTALN